MGNPNDKNRDAGNAGQHRESRDASRHHVRPRFYAADIVSTHPGDNAAADWADVHPTWPDWAAASCIRCADAESHERQLTF